MLKRNTIRASPKLSNLNAEKGVGRREPRLKTLATLLKRQRAKEPPVYVEVGDKGQTAPFDEIVYNKDKDVLVEFYNVGVCIDLSRN
jgi:hypothetical protein